MNDQATDEIRRHLSQVIEILQPYALSSGPLNKQNATTAIRLAASRRAPASCSDGAVAERQPTTEGDSIAPDENPDAEAIESPRSSAMD
jgi:hypothetical protein